MRAIERQLDQVAAAVFALEKSPDNRPFAVSGVIPDHVDDAFILIAVLNLGQQLHGTDAIHCNRREERRIKGFKVQRAVNVDAGATCRSFERGVCTLLHPTKGRFVLTFWMHGICEVYRLIIGQRIQRIFSYIVMNSACLATSATRGSVFGLRYSKPRRAKSLTQPE